MAIVTTTRAGAPIKKPFAWSYSRLKNFETCPKRYYETDIAKSVQQDESEQLAWGDAVHKALAARCGPDRVALPPSMPASYELWAQKVIGNGGEIYTELDLAITEEFEACEYFDKVKKVWLRTKIDFVKIVGDVGLIVDWKTGKILEDSVQLALSAATVFAKFPSVQAVRCAFVWLKEDAESSENFLRSDMPHFWRTIWPRIEALRAAHEYMNFPPVPNNTCRAWCGVKACPNNGKSFR